MTPAGVDILDNTYNLGRIPSQVLSNYLTDWTNSGNDNLFLTTFNNQFGKNEKFCFGVTPLLFGIAGDEKMWALLPEMDFSFVPSPSNRLNLSISPLNLVGVWNSYGSATGFDIPFTVLNMYQWSFLSRKGTITISPDQYDLTFLLGPQLNPGQFRNDLSIIHTINADAVPLRIFDVSAFPRIGIMNGLEVGADLHYSYHDSVTSTMYSSYGSGMYKTTKDSTFIGCKLGFRSSRFFTEAEAGENLWHEKLGVYGYSLFDTSFTDRYGYNDIKLRMSMGLLLGDRIQQFENVIGNWDGFYSNVLGSHQMLNTVSIEALPKETIKTYLHGLSNLPFTSDSSFSSATVDQNTRYGFIDHFELGENFRATMQSYSLPVFNLGFQLSINTVPLRNYGPAAASNQEYFQGMRLKQGQCRGFIRYSPPFFKQELPYEFVPILDRVGTIGSLSSAGTVGGNSSMDGITRLIASSDQTLLTDPDFAMRLSWGITDWLTFSNDIEFDNINYNTAPQQSTVGQLMPSQPDTPTKNSLFANATTLTFHFGDARRLSIAAFYAQQKGTGVENIQGYMYKPLLEDFMLFALFQVAIPYETFAKGLGKVQSAHEVAH